jgi:ABC-2 type transport system permease protein
VSTPPPTPRHAALSSVSISAPRKKSRTNKALTAFLAILRRDIVVTGRDFIGLLIQVLLQPLFFLFIFGKVLPSIGLEQQGYAALLLPGIVALTMVTTAFQGVTVPLAVDLGYAHEIDDRLLAPLPINLVAVEKVFFAAMRGLVTGGIIFPLAYVILGNAYQVRTDAVGVIIGIMILTSFAGASLGLTIGTLVRPEQLGLVFPLIFTPLIFTGCTYYPWSGLNSIKWFQIVTLFNPMTYASEGLRYGMVPSFHGHPLTTLAMHWVLLGLSAAFIVLLLLGMRMFHKRVIG